LGHIYAGKPLEPLIPKCNNLMDWAIRRENYIILSNNYTKTVITDENNIIALNDYLKRE
jgi:hypothetical protein